MKTLFYQSIKISLGVITAIYIASLLNLQYATTAGVITLLSILDTRKQTFVVGFKRIASASIAIVLSSVLFTLGGHQLYILGIFLLIFIPLGVFSKTTEGLSISTVLITHIYTINYIDTSVVLNELYLLFVGILIAWVLNLHVPDQEDLILGAQRSCEDLMKSILRKMALQLVNQCSIQEQRHLFSDLNDVITQGAVLALKHNNNHVFSDHSYYIEYFQMREEQYHILLHMEKHFNQLFIAVDQANPLKDLTCKLADRFDEKNTGQESLNEAEKLLTFYKQSQLPITREEFENRAVLFQYLNDLVRFVEIKRDFMTHHYSRTKI